MGLSNNGLLLLLTSCLSPQRHSRKLKNQGIGKKNVPEMIQPQTPSENRREPAMFSPTLSEDSSLSVNKDPVVSQWPEEKFASNPPTPLSAHGERSGSRDLTARRPSPVSSADPPPDHVPDEAELERRRRGDAQPQLVPLDMVEVKRPASTAASLDVEDVFMDRSREAAGAGVG